MKKLSAAVTGILGISALIFAEQTVYADPGSNDLNHKLIIKTGTSSFTATLENNQTAVAFKSKLPMTILMNDLNRLEKYFNWPENLPVTPFRPDSVQNGDLMLFGSNTVVLFYDTSPNVYSYTRLGRVDNPSGLKTALGAGSVTLTFELSNTGTAKGEKTEKRTASDSALMQTSNPSKPTRILHKGTRINMHFGSTVIPGILNETPSAKALIARLPYTVRVNRYSHDFCGVMEEPLPYREEDVHYGWLNGDIDFATDANYFTILFEDEKNSEQYGHQVNIGVIDCDLSKISKLKGSYSVRIELDQSRSPELKQYP